MTYRSNPIPVGLTFLADGEYVYEKQKLPWAKAVADAKGVAESLVRGWEERKEQAKAGLIDKKDVGDYPYTMLIEERSDGSRVEINLRTGERTTKVETPATRKALELKIRAILEKPSARGKHSTRPPPAAGLPHPLPAILPPVDPQLKGVKGVSKMRMMMLKLERQDQQVIDGPAWVERMLTAVANGRALPPVPDSFAFERGPVIIEHKKKFYILGTPKWFSNRSKAEEWAEKHA